MATGVTTIPATTATTTLITTITTTTGTPATTTDTPVTTGTPATWYRSVPIRPLAPSVTGPTTRRPGRISATMVCGILAHKGKKRAAQTGRSFSMCLTFGCIRTRRGEGAGSRRGYPF